MSINKQCYNLHDHEFTKLWNNFLRWYTHFWFSNIFQASGSNFWSLSKSPRLYWNKLVFTSAFHMNRNLKTSSCEALSSKEFKYALFKVLLVIYTRIFIFILTILHALDSVVIFSVSWNNLNENELICSLFQSGIFSHFYSPFLG